MKEKFWRQLKSRLCPRQNWVRDIDSNKCQCCGKQFTFIRRRHHCRFCGKLFCNHCSDLYINGTYLGLSQKYVRHCQFCKQEIQKIKKDLNRLTYMVQEEEDFVKSEQDDQSGSSSDQDGEFFSIKAIFGQSQKESQLQFAKELDFQIKNMSKKMFNRLVEVGNINQQYLNSRLMEYLTRAVIQSRMNILPHDLNSRSSYMDIAKQVVIKTLNGHAGEYLQLVQGIILQKSLPVKHMLNKLIKPQLIIIQNSLDQSGVKVRFEDLISNDHVISEQLEEKIMKFNPDIVFVQRTINREILDFFSERGITVISGIKKKDIFRIIQISGVRSTIKNVWAIEKYKPEHLIGTLDLMHTKKFEKNTQPIIYFQKNIGVYSIIVSERSHDNQSILKRSLQMLMRFLRIIHLQKYLIYVDFQMWQDRQFKNISRLTRINPNLLSYLQKMRCEQIQFYHLRYSEKQLQKQDKKLRQYCRSLNRSHYFQNCGEDTHFIITPYSEDDNTIGHFLLIMATNFINKCSQCKLHHRERYYFTDYGIQISINSLKENRDHQEIHDQNDLNIQKMHKYLKKYKENWNIFSYFQCKYCQHIVSKRVKIGKNYLKNSFYYFLYLVANSQEWSLPSFASLQTNKSQQKVFSSNLSNLSIASKSNLGKQSPRRKNVLKQCMHSIVERVLQTSDIIFRMQVFTVNNYEISLIDLKDENFQSIYRENLRQYIIELANTQIEQKFSLQDTLKDIVNNYIGVLEPFRFQESVDSKIIIELEKLESIREILGRLHNHLQQFWVKQKAKEYNHNSDWTFFVREMAKIDYIMKSVIDILRVIQGNLYKRKKKIEQVQSVSIYTNEECQPFIANNESEPKQDYTFGVSRQNSQDNEVKIHNIDAAEITSYRLSREKSQDEKHSNKSFTSFARKIHNNSIFTFSLVYDQTKLRKYYEEIKRRRYQLKKGQSIYFNLVNYKKTISILVCALNSIDFKEQFDRKNVDVFKFNLILSKDMPTSWDLKLKIDKLKGQMIDDESQPRESYQVIVYYHRQFQHFREMQGITYDTYIKSLANSQFWQTVGGKSNSQFAKSADQLLVIKTIKHQEFGQFLKFASDYLRHIKTSNKDSYLAKIYGIYEVVIKGDSYKCVVMQNLFLGFQGLPFKKYDLKGSKVNRLYISKSNGQNITGLDTNFRIDKNYHPYFISRQSYAKFFNALEEDIAFLCKNQVIDYSLLVIEHENKLRMGIIDFMRPYHLMQKIQNKYKQLTNKMLPTVLPPRQYADRFLSAMKQYFAFYN